MQPHPARCRWRWRPGSPRRAPEQSSATQPGGGDHRRRQRRADHRGQRVQAPDQQRFALDLGVPEPGALLVVPVDPFLHPVDVNERQSSRAGQQRRLPGQRDQELPARLLHLADVSPGIAAQVRPQRGRRRTPPNSVLIAPCRSRSMSSIDPPRRPSRPPGTRPSGTR